MNEEKILELKNKVFNDNSEENIIEFLNYLINNTAYMVVDMEIDDETKKKLESLNPGEEVSYETDTISFSPIVVNSEDGMYLPVFSRQEECTSEDLNTHTFLNLGFMEIINIYKGNKELKGIVLDPFTESFTFNTEDIESILKDIENSNED